MKIAVNGTKGFSNYDAFLRAMRVVLSEMNKNQDKDLVIYSAGPANVNAFAREFFNITERSMKSMGIHVRINNRPFSEIQNSIGDMDYLAFFCREGESKGLLVDNAEALDVEVGIYRF
jgi:hypothetical protein